MNEDEPGLTWRKILEIANEGNFDKTMATIRRALPSKDDSVIGACLVAIGVAAVASRGVDVELLDKILDDAEKLLLNGVEPNNYSASIREHVTNLLSDLTHLVPTAVPMQQQLRMLALSELTARKSRNKGDDTL